MSTETESAPRPWFNEPMAWLVLALPASAVVAGITTAVIAWNGADGAAANDTYRSGLAIDEVLARTARAHELGIEAEVTGGPGGKLSDADAVFVRVRARAALPDESTLDLRWVHPGRSSSDWQARLVRTGFAPDGRNADYVGRVVSGEPTAANTVWRLVLTGRQWRLDGEYKGSIRERATVERRAARDETPATQAVPNLGARE